MTPSIQNQAPLRPNGVKNISVVGDLTKSYVVANGFSSGYANRLPFSRDELEWEIGLDLYDRMETDPAYFKAKKIVVTSVLADELQFSPGATEDEVGPEEYKNFVEVMQFSQRVIDGLEGPLRGTLEQLLGNAFKYGNGFAETEWDYRMDINNKEAQDDKTKQPAKSKLSAMMGRFGIWSKEESVDVPTKPNKSVFNDQTRLMPIAIKVKPRRSADFVVDDYWNLLGLAPTYRTNQGPLRWDEVVDRDHFMLYTMNKQDEDPRGRSSYRAGFNAWNVKQNLPAEAIRFVVEEIVPKSVATLAPDAPAFEFARDANDDIIYETNEDGSKSDRPIMKTAVESMGDQIKGFSSGSGAVIPAGAKLEPFKRAGGTSDADMFSKLYKLCNDEIEYSTLLQTLAQSEGDHQARSASEQVAQVLHNLVFWVRWGLSTMIMYDLIDVAIRINLGEWALAYRPQVSLGDFVRRNWVDDLSALADAYFKGFLDDTQRAEIMAWLNLPKPGPSRQELGLDAQGVVPDPATGNPATPNKNRPDKQGANKNRNNGNGTEKKKNVNASYDSSYRFSPLNALGHHGGRALRAGRYLFSGPK